MRKIPYSVGFLRHLIVGLWPGGGGAGWTTSSVGECDAEKLSVLYSDAEMVNPCGSVRLEMGRGSTASVRSRLGMAWRGRRCSGAHIHQNSVCKVKGKLCNLGQVTQPLSTTVSSPVKWEFDQMTTEVYLVLMLCNSLRQRHPIGLLVMMEMFYNYAAQYRSHWLPLAIFEMCLV